MSLLDWLRGRLAAWRSARIEAPQDEHRSRAADRRSDGEKVGPSRSLDRPMSDAGPTEPAYPGQRDQVVMGVDVGTSLSKVVVSVRGRRVAVTFDAPGGENNPYLLPTAVSVMPDGECRLGLHDGASERYEDIKRPLIDGHVDGSVRLPMIAFMVLLFQHVQKRIEESESRVLGGRLDWLVNLGVPTASYGGGSRGVNDLVSIYCWSAKVAWGLMDHMRREGDGRTLTLDRCRRAMHDGLKARSGRIKVFPEFVPQVASYVKSKQRQQGVHVFIDVGSGTLDVTVFQVLTSGVENAEVPVWARTVQPLGVRYLIDHVCEGFGYAPAWRPVGGLPLEAAIARTIGVSSGQFRVMVMPFRDRIVNVVGETIREAGKFRLRWPGRMFLGGGGAFTDLYKGIAEEFEQKRWKFGIRWVPLPRPDDLDAPAIGDTHWHRLAVAYGLSYDPLDIGEIKPPEDIERVLDRYWEPPDPPPPFNP